jgi:hypothetical protein
MKPMKTILSLAAATLPSASALSAASGLAPGTNPNSIVILTDDQN